MTASSTYSTKNWLPAICAGILLVSFFLPWVNWDGSKIAGYDMPAGNFFKIAGARFGLDNPFPQFSFVFLVFWLIPALSALVLFLGLTGRKTGLLPFITGFLSLSLVTVYLLFTAILIDLGAGSSVFSMVTIFAWIHAIAAAGLILSTAGANSMLKKAGWLLAGPAFVFASFHLTEKYIMNETHKDTASVKADYTVEAAELIKEFMTNDTGANKKYLEKMILVKGNTASVDVLPDSTSTIRFADSTGSYAIFSLEKNQFADVKILRSGEPVSLKAVCSGSIFSEILGTTSISFKRATLIKN
ncbi:MAG: hypothetical protein ABIT05_13115 [Chitinophagaceae bacterium]